jgi:hypothetical protein
MLGSIRACFQNAAVGRLPHTRGVNVLPQIDTRAGPLTSTARPLSDRMLDLKTFSTSAIELWIIGKYDMAASLALVPVST